MTLLKTTLAFAALSISTIAFAEKTYTIEFPGFSKAYNIVSTGENVPVDIVYINFRDDVEIISAAAKALADKVPEGTEYVVILGDKANIMGAMMATHKNIPWIVLITKEIPEGVFAKSNVFQSITSPGTDKTIYLSKAQAEKIKGKKVVIMDDVVSTGATMKAGIEVLIKADAKVQGVMCASTEGKQIHEISGYPIISLMHTPVFPKA